MHVYKCPRCVAKVALYQGAEHGPECLAHGADVVPMRHMEDAERAILPLDQAPSIAPMRVDSLKAAGILMPETKDALEWLYRHRATNGMAEAFLNVGGRRCIDLVAFARLMREKRA
jgi:hypothetical protein